MIAELGPVAQGWVFIVGFGITFFVFGLTLYRAFDGLITYGRDPDPGPDPEIGAGGMTPERREAVLQFLLARWSEGDKPLMDITIASLGHFSEQQTISFMHWAHGQVRERWDGEWIAITERGTATRWMRFRAVRGARVSVLKPRAGSGRQDAGAPSGGDGERRRS